MPPMTKKDAKAFRRRWRMVNDFTLQESRRASVQDRYRDYLSLMELALALGWDKDLSREDALVRQRWNELRKAYRGKETKKRAAG